MPKVPSSFQLARSADFPYFRRLWGTIVVALLAASLIPMILIGGGMYYYAVFVLRQKTVDALQMEIVSHKQAIDSFLEERLRDLQLLSANIGPGRLTAPGVLQSVFQSFQQPLAYYTDIGVIDPQGRHLAYVGPHDLMSKNYRNEKWFQAVMERGAYISDVYLGFRGKPHFVIAVKSPDADKPWVLRATVDTVGFDNIVSKVLGSREGDAFLINKEGRYQTRTRSQGKLMQPSGKKDIAPFRGVRFSEEPDGRLVLMTWLDKAPWLCVAEFMERDIYGPLRRIRNLGIYVFVVGCGLIVLTVFFSTNYLVSRLEKKRRSIHSLDHQLRQAARSTSSMMLASGLVKDISESMSNMDLIIQWLEEHIQGTSTGGLSGDSVRESLKQVKTEVNRTRGAADRFFRIAHPVIPIVKEVRVGDILNEILELFEREFYFRRIRIERDYQEPLPAIRCDASEIQQVFQELIMNAVEAIGEDGKIVLKTRKDEEGLAVDVSDSGRGIQPDHLDMIFDPLFTTQPGRPGLGLSISADILKRMGGRISVKSEPGRGSLFTVHLPLQTETS